MWLAPNQMLVVQLQTKEISFSLLILLKDPIRLPFLLRILVWIERGIDQTLEICGLQGMSLGEEKLLIQQFYLRLFVLGCGLFWNRGIRFLRLPIHTFGDEGKFSPHECNLWNTFSINWRCSSHVSLKNIKLSKYIEIFSMPLRTFSSHVW